MLRALYELVLVLGVCAVLVLFAPLLLREAPPDLRAQEAAAWRAWEGQTGTP